MEVRFGQPNTYGATLGEVRGLGGGLNNGIPNVNLHGTDEPTSDIGVDGQFYIQDVEFQEKPTIWVKLNNIWSKTTSDIDLEKDLPEVTYAEYLDIPEEERNKKIYFINDINLNPGGGSGGGGISKEEVQQMIDDNKEAVVLKLNSALSEEDLLNHLSTNYPSIECSGFFYNTDEDEYCEFEFLYVPYEIGSETIHFGYCHIKGLHKSTYACDYLIDDEDGDTWYKRIPSDYVDSVTNVSLDTYNALTEEEKKNGDVYFVDSESDKYIFKTNEDKTIIVRLDKTSNDIKWFFNGFVATSGEIDVPSNLVEYVPSLNNSEVVMTAGFDSVSSAVQTGWVGFYNNGIKYTIRFWSVSTTTLITGKFWGVLDNDTPRGDRGSTEKYFDPYEGSGEYHEIYYMGNKYSDGGSSTHTYSTEEQVVGTFIDGKTIYEKSIPYEVANWRASNTFANVVSDPGEYNQIFDSVPDIDRLLSAEILTDLFIIKLFNVYVANKTNKTIGYGVSATPASNTKYIAIQYTKTTD